MGPPQMEGNSKAMWPPQRRTSLSDTHMQTWPCPPPPEHAYVPPSLSIHDNIGLLSQSVGGMFYSQAWWGGDVYYNSQDAPGSDLVG